MKTPSKTLLLSLLGGLALAGITAHATVTFVGNDLVTDAAWRTASVTKANDLDGDHIYGTTGYYLAAGLRADYRGTFLPSDNHISGAGNPDDINMLPPYILALDYTNPSERGRSWGGSGGNFGTMDKVNAQHTGFTGAAILLQNAGDFGPMSLTLRRENSPAFRLTLILGNNPDEGPFSDPNGQQITVDDGSGAVTQISGAPEFYARTTYQSWDISAGSSDIVIALLGLPEGGGLARLSGLAIDSLTASPPVITRQPVGGTFAAGIRYELKVEASGLQLTYQWLKNDAPIAGATSATYALANLAAADAGSYVVEVKNPAATVRSQAAVLTVGAVPDKTVRYQNAVLAESSLISYYTFDSANGSDRKNAHPGEVAGAATFTAGIGGDPAKALTSTGNGHLNLGRVEDFDFADGTGTITAWVRADWAASPGYNPTIFSLRDGGSTVWSIHMMAPKNQIAHWNGSAVSTFDIPGAGTDWHYLAVVFNLDTWTVFWDGIELGTKDQFLGFGTELPTELGSASPAGQEVWVGALDEVAFFSEPLTSATLMEHYRAFTAGDPPSITGQPKGGSYFVGSPVTLTVSAMGPDLAYQWLKNGQPIAGATSATFELAQVTAADQGQYTVEVSNPGGKVTSDAAQVRVVVPKLADYQAAVKAESSLISYYPFDDATADDKKGTNHGTPEGDAGFGPGVGGGNDQTLLLTGGGFVNLGPVPAFTFPTGDGTVEAWIRADYVDNPPYNPAIIAAREGGSTLWSLHLMLNRLQIAHWNGSAVALIDIPHAGQAWHHLVSVFSQGTWTLYWDGQLAGTRNQPFGNLTDAPTELGSSSTGGSEQWIGALDEVAFYSTALTEAEVRKHYNALVGIVESPTLNFTRAGDQLTLSWTAPGFVLQENTDLSNSAGWVNTTGGATSPVTVPTASGTKYYRLKQ